MIWAFARFVKAIEMLRSAIRLPLNESRRIVASHRISHRILTDGFPRPQTPSSSQHEEQTVAGAPPEKEEQARQQPRGSRRVSSADYQAEQALVLQAALRHVGSIERRLPFHDPSAAANICYCFVIGDLASYDIILSVRPSGGPAVKLGWSEAALISGARDVGLSPSIVSSFTRKEAAPHFMDECLQRLINRIDAGEGLKSLILSERLAKLIRIRLEMQEPYLSKWPQALSIQAQPPNIATSFKRRAMLVDEIWHAVGDEGSDINWYVKRTILGGIYSTSEVYMLGDHSPEFRDTWSFLDHRIKDAFGLQKTVQEAVYLAEAVGAGMGNSLQVFMRKVFHG
ncbi:hypothetical protein ACLOJK_001021 [Asimina triloba]